jgi:DNA-binding NarL/FixJ family response regulator
VQSLSKREREVFGLLASGMTIKQVAESLGRSEKTIEGHRDSIYRKLNVGNRAEIAILAMEAGLMPARRSATMGE